MTVVKNDAGDERWKPLTKYTDDQWLQRVSDEQDSDI